MLASWIESTSSTYVWLLYLKTVLALRRKNAGFLTPSLTQFLHTVQILMALTIVSLERRALQEEEERQQKDLRRRFKHQERLQKREAYEALERQKKLMAEEMDRDLKGNDFMLYINAFGRTWDVIKYFF